LERAVANKYAKEGRVREEVERVYEKIKADEKVRTLSMEPRSATPSISPRQRTTGTRSVRSLRS
jgi:hypothetical protein